MRTKGTLAVAAIVSILATGCLKTVENSKQDPLSLVYLMHVAPKAPAVETYFDGTKVSDGIAPGAISVSYSAVASGIFGVSFKKAGADSLVAEVPTLSYDSAKAYTLILYNDADGKGKAVRVSDDFSNITYDKAYYRFFQMVPNLDKVDLYIDGTAYDQMRLPADNVNNNFFNQFSPIGYGYHTIQIKLTGTETLIAQAIDVRMDQGNAYTIVLKGLAGQSGAYAPSIAVAKAVY